MKTYLYLICMVTLLTCCTSQKLVITLSENEKTEGKSESIDALFKQEFEKTKDPHTGTVPKDRLVESFNYGRKKRA